MDGVTGTRFSVWALMLVAFRLSGEFNCGMGVAAVDSKGDDGAVYPRRAAGRCMKNSSLAMRGGNLRKADPVLF